MLLRSNDDLQKDVMDALAWHPQLFMVDIDVIAKEGVVTLAGVVNSYGQKEEALKIAKDVVGVKAVAENIRVKINTWSDPADEVIEKQINSLFKWQWNISEDQITIKVDNGWVTLEGSVEEQYQKEAAYKAVSILTGVKGINNKITLLPQPGTKIQIEQIRMALTRNAYLGREDINIETSGNRIVLTGSVSSWYKKGEAEKIVWCAPGVQQVDNQLVIEMKDK